MNRLMLGAATLALVSSTALAQSRYGDDRYRDDGPRYEQRDQRFRPGDTVPYDLRRGGHHIQNDWRGADLRRPPRGYAWMELGDQYVLADQQTGLVRDVRSVRRHPTMIVRGGIVPYEYRAGGHNIEYDWRGAGLRRPPEGYAWMKIGDQYILADQQNGKIADIEPLRDYGRRGDRD